MPKIETHEFSRTVKQQDSLQTISLKNGVVAYFITETWDLVDKEGRPKFKASEPHTRQGLVTQKKLDDYLSGKCGLGGNDFELVTPKIMEGLRRRGWNYGQEERLEWALPHPFDAVRSGKEGKDFHIVKFLNDCHMMEDSAGKKLPVGMHFDYIDANMNNKSYDLEKAVEILNKNPNIDFLYDQYKPDDPIQAIPHYNVSEGSSRYLGFWWAPTVKEYRRLWKKCLSIGGNYPSTNRYRAVFELDLLGLRKGKAAKFKSFYGAYD